MRLTMGMLQQNCSSAFRSHKPFLPQVQGEHIGAAAGQCNFKARVTSSLTAPHDANGLYQISYLAGSNPKSGFLSWTRCAASRPI